MNTTTKVFIVINLLLALGFAYIQMLNYATRENWKRRWDHDTQELSKDLQNANRIALEESTNRVIAENVARSHQLMIRDLEADIEGLKGEIQGLNQDKTDLQKQNDKQDAHIHTQREQIEALNKSLENTRQRNSELNTIANVARAVAFELNVKLAELEDDYNNATMEKTRLQEAVHRLEQEMIAREAKLAVVREKYPDVWNDVITLDTEEVLPQIVSGVVAAVRVGPDGQQELVMLSIGENEGLKPGNQFIIFRDNQYICKVRVHKVLKDMSACRIVADTWNTKGLKVKQGDQAQNRMW